MKDKIILISSDLSSLTLSFLLAFFIRISPFSTNQFGLLSYNAKAYLVSFIVSSIILLAVFGGFKLYQIRRIELSARIFTVLKALSVWTFITASLMYFIKFDFSRGIFFMAVVFSFILICLCRYFHFRIRHNKDSGQHIETIIIGTGHRADSIERQIKDIYRHSICKKLDYADNNTYSLLKSYSKTEIFIADETLPRDHVLSIIADENLSHHSFRVILDIFRLATGEVRLNDMDEIPSISPQAEPQTLYKLTKRLIDIIISALGIVISLPVWLIVTLLIKLDSPGPVLIRQRRIGYNKKPFTIFKFRTMYNNTELYKLAPKNQTDERITGIGRLLRRFSLDELPQLWNILKGDMSLVGPRPEMEFIVKNYAPWQTFRLKAKPGLTGLWQILGRKDLPLHENLEYDFYYVTNRSLLLDCSIILKTVPAVLFGRGAY